MSENNENTVEYAGKVITQLTLAELKELAVANNVDLGDAKLRKDILPIMEKWEADNAANDDGRALKRAPVNATKGKKAQKEEEVLDFHEGKKVISRTPRDINGVSYEDILVEGGVTHTERI